MLGLINISFEAYIVESFGRERWMQIKGDAGLVAQSWVSGCPYADVETYRLIEASSEQLHMTPASVLEGFGGYFITNFLNDLGYSDLVRHLGSNIVQLASRLDDLHHNVAAGMPAMKMPYFRVDQVTPESLLLHYYSDRPNLWPISAGILKAIARDRFDHDLTVELVLSKEDGHDHEVMKLGFPAIVSEEQQPSSPLGPKHEEAGVGLMMGPEIMCQTFPFHVAVDERMVIQQAGPALMKLIPGLRIGITSFSQCFTVVGPRFHSQSEVDFTSLENNMHAGFVLEVATADKASSSTNTGDLAVPGSLESSKLQLKGQMVVASFPCRSPAVQATGCPRDPAVQAAGCPRDPAVQATGCPRDPAVQAAGCLRDPAVQATGCPRDPAVQAAGCPRDPAVQAAGCPRDPGVQAAGCPQDPAVQAGSLCKSSSCPHGRPAEVYPHGMAMSGPLRPSAVACVQEQRAATCGHGRLAEACSCDPSSAVHPHGPAVAASCPHGPLAVECPPSTSAAACLRDNVAACTEGPSAAAGLPGPSVEARPHGRAAEAWPLVQSAGSSCLRANAAFWPYEPSAAGCDGLPAMQEVCPWLEQDDAVPEPVIAPIPPAAVATTSAAEAATAATTSTAAAAATTAATTKYAAVGNAERATDEDTYSSAANTRAAAAGSTVRASGITGAETSSTAERTSNTGAATVAHARPPLRSSPYSRCWSIPPRRPSVGVAIATTAAACPAGGVSAAAPSGGNDAGAPAGDAAAAAAAGGGGVGGDGCSRLDLHALPTQRLALFLGSPCVQGLSQLGQHGLSLYDLPLMDRSVDMALKAEQSRVEMGIREGYEALTMQLQYEKERSESMLYRCVPKEFAQQLREGHAVEATSFDKVTIMFTDIVDFTAISGKMPPIQVCRMLSELYERFDNVIDLYPDVWKADVIGDSYMLVSNLTRPVDDHVDMAIDLAIQLQVATREACTWLGKPLQIRIGIHTGPAAAGVVGSAKSTGLMRYSIYGDTVNTASRMESHGLPGKIHISQASFECIHHVDKYVIKERGRINVKGKGGMQTHLIASHQASWLLQVGNQKAVEKMRMRCRKQDSFCQTSKPSAFGDMSKQASFDQARPGSSPQSPADTSVADMLARSVSINGATAASRLAGLSLRSSSFEQAGGGPRDSLTAFTASAAIRTRANSFVDTEAIGVEFLPMQSRLSYADSPERLSTVSLDPSSALSLELSPACSGLQDTLTARDKSNFSSGLQSTTSMGMALSNNSLVSVSAMLAKRSLGSHNNNKNSSNKCSNKKKYTNESVTAESHSSSLAALRLQLQQLMAPRSPGVANVSPVRMGDGSRGQPAQMAATSAGPTHAFVSYNSAPFPRIQEAQAAGSHGGGPSLSNAHVNSLNSSPTSSCGTATRCCRLSFPGYNGRPSSVRLPTPDVLEEDESICSELLHIGDGAEGSESGGQRSSSDNCFAALSRAFIEDLVDRPTPGSTPSVALSPVGEEEAEPSLSLVPANLPTYRSVKTGPRRSGGSQNQSPRSSGNSRTYSRRLSLSLRFSAPDGLSQVVEGKEIGDSMTGGLPLPSCEARADAAGNSQPWSPADEVKRNVFSFVTANRGSSQGSVGGAPTWSMTERSSGSGEVMWGGARLRDGAHAEASLSLRTEEAGTTLSSPRRLDGRGRMPFAVSGEESETRNAPHCGCCVS